MCKNMLYLNKLYKCENCFKMQVKCKQNIYKYFYLLQVRTYYLNNGIKYIQNFELNGLIFSSEI